MNDPISSLLAHQSIRKYAPANEAEIKALTVRLQAQLPEELLAVWRVSNGLGIPSVNAELMSVSVVDKWFDNYNPNFELGLLPILDTHSSNYVTACFCDPLMPRVAWFPHDNNPKLLYKDINRFFEVLLECLNHNAELEADEDFDRYESEEIIDAELFFSETQGDYSNETERTPEDKGIGQKLLQQTPKDAQNWNREFALQLLGA